MNGRAGIQAKTDWPQGYAILTTLLVGWMDRWTCTWTHGWMDGWKGGRTEGNSFKRNLWLFLRVHTQPAKSIIAFPSASAILFSEVRIFICRRKCRHIVFHPTDEIILESRCGVVHLTNFRSWYCLGNWTRMSKQTGYMLLYPAINLMRWEALSFFFLIKEIGVQERYKLIKATLLLSGETKFCIRANLAPELLLFY